MVRNLTLGLKPIYGNNVSLGVVDTSLWRMNDCVWEDLMKERGEKSAAGKVGQVEDIVESFWWC